jgi:glycerol-3-phosphate dehydrogenase (NAD(P)+)
VAASDIPSRVGQAVEALETVPLLAGALATAGLASPVTSALAGLIEGSVPLEEWVAIVRTTVPPPAIRPRPRRVRGFWRNLWARVRTRGRRRNTIFTPAEPAHVTLAAVPDPKERADAPHHRDG